MNMYIYIYIYDIYVIGDGGNEVGMGKVYSKIIDSDIPNAKDIACIIPSDYLIVCSVSNWGGYALAAAIGAIQSPITPDYCSSSEGESGSRRASGVCTVETLRNNITRFLPTDEEEINKCSRMVDAGARDGVRIYILYKYISI